MAGSYNRIVLVGNLVRDPEIRYIASGSAVTKFTLAMSRKVKGKDEATFVDIIAWDKGNYKLAETCNTYLKKGMSALVEGRLVIRAYEDKDGHKRKATEVVIDVMRMLSRIDAPTAADPLGEISDNDDDIPLEMSPPFSHTRASTSDATATPAQTRNPRDLYRRRQGPVVDQPHNYTEDTDENTQKPDSLYDGVL